MIPLVDMQLGEIVFGGVGSGLYGMIVFVVLTVFIAGLMVGRTPELLGKKIERREVQFAILAASSDARALRSCRRPVAAVIPAGLATLNNGGPHGFSEILYAFTSTNANNGSAFAGLGPNLFYNLVTGDEHVLRTIRRLSFRCSRSGRLDGRKEVGAEGPGTFTTHSRGLRRSARRRHRYRRRPHVSPGGFARTNRRTSARSARENVLMLSQRRLDRRPKARSLLDRAILSRALTDSLKKLDPRCQARNPVMFVVEVGAAATTIFFVRDLAGRTGMAGFDFAIAAWLWFTVLFANFAEAVAEGRGKAQAETLRRTKSDTYARQIEGRRKRGTRRRQCAAQRRSVRRRGQRYRCGGRRRRRRRGDGRRVGNHRRVGSGDSRIGRRSQRRDRRHARTLRPDRRARYG